MHFHIRTHQHFKRTQGYFPMQLPTTEKIQKTAATCIKQ